MYCENGWRGGGKSIVFEELNLFPRHFPADSRRFTRFTPMIAAEFPGPFRKNPLKMFGREVDLPGYFGEVGLLAKVVAQKINGSCFASKNAYICLKNNCYYDNCANRQPE